MTCESRYQALCGHNERKPDFRTQTSQEDVRNGLAEAVCEEEVHQCEIELMGCHADIFEEAEELGIAGIGLVETAHQVQEAESWQQTPIDLDVVSQRPNIEGQAAVAYVFATAFDAGVRWQP